MRAIQNREEKKKQYQQRLIGHSDMEMAEQLENGLEEKEMDRLQKQAMIQRRSEKERKIHPVRIVLKKIMVLNK